MTVPVPKFDERGAKQIAAEVRALLSVDDSKSDGLDVALIQVFARFAELVIHRLNRAPEKNLLAFLDLLGVSQLPMQAARVPLTFSMAPGSAVCARVPAGTQVAAPPREGEQKPVIFETERELVVTPAKLDSLLMQFAARDQYKDLGTSLALPSVADAGVVELSAAGALLIPHVLYVAVPVNALWPGLDQLRVRFELEEGKRVDARVLEWGMTLTAAVESTKSVALVAQEDTTQNLTQSGDVVFANLPRMKLAAVDGAMGYWLACRLQTPITRDADATDGMVRAAQLPVVKQITCQMELARKGLAIEQAFYNAQKLDLTKDFYPFGERPKFGDVLYLASREVFSDADAKIALQVKLTNPQPGAADADGGTAAAHGLQLSWEFWNGQVWMKLGKSRLVRVEGETASAGFEDGTNSLASDGDVSFRFSSTPQETIVNGQKNYWIRVRIAGGYGEAQSSVALAGRALAPAPPSIKSIRIDYEVKKEAPPTAILAYNNFAYERVDLQKPFKPFVPVVEQSSSPCVYFGFAVDGPAGAKQRTEPIAGLGDPGLVGKFPSRAVSMYVAAADTKVKDGGEPTSSGLGVCEYWNGVSWKKLSVRDETESLRRSGLIQFLPPADFVTRNEFGRERYWLRMWPAADSFDGGLRHVLLNTTMAVQGMSVVNDILGSSDGKATQKFQTTQAMVLPGQKLEVLEPTLPPEPERTRVRADEGDDAIQMVADVKGKGHHFWVTWHEVPNFYGSRQRDRHYILNHVTGEVTFGDGAFGLIPPVLPGNIRMTRYRSGGGVRGNQPVQAVSKLTSAVPYIQKVGNWMPTGGGTDPEEDARLLERGSRGVRHGGRAVTYEDFEDLAMLASRDVAHAKCVPFFDLSPGLEAKRRGPGALTLIVVPRSADDFAPMPGSDLLERVRSYVDARRLPTLDLVVTGPEYARVDVEAEVAVHEPEDANDVEIAIRAELDRYLHPVMGGPDGCGWEFGRLPQKFDLSVLLERIPGVSHVRELRVKRVGEPDARKAGQFLICRGEYRIALVLEEERAVEFA